MDPSPRPSTKLLDGDVHCHVLCAYESPGNGGDDADSAVVVEHRNVTPANDDGLDPSDKEFAAHIETTHGQTAPVAQAGNIIYAFGFAVAVAATIALAAAVVAAAARYGSAALSAAAVGVICVFYAALLIGVGKSMSMLSSYVELRTLEMERHWIAEDDDDS